MLNTVFKDAIINREKTLSILKGPEYEKIIQKAKENWIDYTPKKQQDVKIKSKNNDMSIALTPTVDIIKTIAKNTNATIVAFALETCDGEANALEKLKSKGADYIVLNHPMDDGCGIDSNYNKVSILSNKYEQFDIKKDRKDRVARQILEFIISKQA